LNISYFGVGITSTFSYSWIPSSFFLHDPFFKGPMVFLAIPLLPELLHFWGPVIHWSIFPPPELSHGALLLSLHLGLIPLYLLDSHK
jgi:hypothetical protein